QAERFILIAGGIGITPIISLLRSAADTRDPRPFLLLYGSLHSEHITLREERERLGPHPPLRRQPPSDVLSPHLFLCGPPPMVIAATAGLEDLGVPPERVHVEQFVTV